jgi:nitrogen fixation NifU-like protein
MLIISLCGQVTIVPKRFIELLKLQLHYALQSAYTIHCRKLSGSKFYWLKPTVILVGVRMIENMDNSDLSELRELYQSAILEQSKRPYGKISALLTDNSDNKSLLTEQNPNGTITHQVNTTCGDELFLSFTIANDAITQIKWVGSGCAISEASASLMSQLLEQQTTAQAEHLVTIFHKMLTDFEADAWEIDTLLGDAAVFYNVRNYPNRIKCALLSWMGAQSLLKGDSCE